MKGTKASDLGGKKRSTKNSKARQVLNKKLAAYSAMATGVVGVTPSSQGVVTVFKDINAAATSSGIGLNVVVDIDGMMATTIPSTGAIPNDAEFEVANPTNAGSGTFIWDPRVTGHGGMSLVNASNQTAANSRWAYRLSSSQSVGPLRGFGGNGLLFASVETSYDPANVENHAVQPWSPGDTGFVGFRLDVGGGHFQYGWIQLQVDPQRGGPITVLAAGLETSVNTPIHIDPTESSAAIVPEPATFGLSLLALGAVGVSALKRRHALVT